MIGSYLEKFRQASGVSRTELGLTTGITQSYVSQVLNEKKYPTKDILMNLLEGLAKHEVEANLGQSLEFSEYDMLIQDKLEDYIREIVEAENTSSSLDKREKNLLLDLKTIIYSDEQVSLSSVKVFDNINKELLQGKNITLDLKNLFHENLKLTVGGEVLSKEEKLLLQYVVKGMLSKRI